MFKSGSIRMVLKRPLEIFSTPPPPPPPWTASASISLGKTCRTSAPLKWNESGDKLSRALRRLQTTLRSVHRRVISWPAEEPTSSESLTPREYLMMLLQPIPDVFNQLHSRRVLDTPMKCVEVDLGHSICGATFTADDFELWDVTAPIILSLPDNLFDPSGKISSVVEFALYLALEHTPSAPIIVTNFQDIATFIPPAHNRPEATFQRIATTQPPLALRVLAMAYLNSALPGGVFIETPRRERDVDEDVVLPQGPPQNPHQPLLPDEQVFTTHHRHSHFDMATLVRDRERALQFFRWHKYVQSRFSKLVAHPSDILSAKTNDSGLNLPDIHPFYPFKPSELPSDTAAHFKEVQRESPLVTARVAESFTQSQAFTLKVLDVVAEGSERGICTVYRCEITSIDGVPVSTPPLCLKLFDDRFQQLQSPYDEPNDDSLPRWFDNVVFAEWYALNEAFAYDKLGPVQGTVIPWFYGAHQFTLPDGTILCGLLMEYIAGWQLSSSFTSNLSPDRQAKMIQSCRHASRLLDIADISQRDWHDEQVILCTNPITNVDHAVLIDFASTTQTWEPEELNFLGNYFGLLHVLLGGQGAVGLDPNLVWEHYGEPDDWDPVRAWIPTENGMRAVQGKNMFPYISSA